MGQYRVEISPNNRAGCKDTVCKKNGVKITKGQLRFATWAEIQEHGSWAWKHWGCVSGFQLGSVQDDCGTGDGEYDFDSIDGYDEIEDEDVKEKIRRCVKQGFIDPEDFNGDPEKNAPGVKGIHLTDKQREKKEREAAEAAEDGDAPAKKTKRGRKKVEDDEDGEPQPKKAKKATKGKASAKNVKEESEDSDAPIAPKAKKAPKAAAAEAKTEPAKKGRKKQAKTESESEEPAPKAKSKRGRPRKA